MPDCENMERPNPPAILRLRENLDDLGCSFSAIGDADIQVGDLLAKTVDDRVAPVGSIAMCVERIDARTLKLDFGNATNDAHWFAVTVQEIANGFKRVTLEELQAEVDATQGGNAEAPRLPEYFVRHNRFVSMLWLAQPICIGRCGRATSPNGGYRREHDLVIETSPLLLNFSTLCQERENPNTHSTNLDDPECLKTLLFESVQRGRRVFTPLMCWAVNTRANTPFIGGSRDVGMDDSFETGQVETSARKVEASVFPSMCSCGTSVMVARRESSVELDVSYAMWLGGPCETFEFLDRKACCQALRERWVPLPHGRDAISRFVANEGLTEPSALWSYYDTRARRKCSVRTLLGNIRKPNDGVNYANGPFSSDDNTTLNLDGQLVIANSSSRIEDGRFECDWREMNETVTVELLNRYGELYQPDTAPIEHFAMNLRDMARLVVHKELCADFPVYWPFGIQSKDAGDPGGVYESRIDLVGVGTSDGDPSECVLVKYKTRTEDSRNTPEEYLMRARDIAQLRLDAWMLYLNTGIVVSRAYTLQASRRQPEDGSKTVPRGVAVKLAIGDPKGGWASIHMTQLITRFAIHPHGNRSVVRYADEQFIAPDLSALMVGLGMKIGAALRYEEATGRHSIFSQVLRSSCFARAVDVAIGCAPSSGGIHIGLPDDCFISGGVARAQVYPSFQSQTARCLGQWTVLDSHAQMQREWATHTKSLSAKHAAFLGAGFVPVLFDRNGAGLLYCNSAFGLTIHRTQLGNPLPPTTSRSRIGATHKSLNHEQPASDVLRRTLTRAVHEAALSIESALVKVHGSRLHEVSSGRFWQMTTEDMAMHPPTSPLYLPQIRGPSDSDVSIYLELTTLNAMEAKGHGKSSRKPPRHYRQALSKWRTNSIAHCMHRLLNKRVSQVALALSGVHHEADQWTEDIGWPGSRNALLAAIDVLLSEGKRADGHTTPAKVGSESYAIVDLVRDQLLETLVASCQRLINDF